ncbi:hypothetical protein HOLleu_01328 [Holothuria leucospilota]|uniref:Uncharacterized protein n=1 Tax=Holothuria leucospilota TaxID=206669 RepID=A0A9Q1HKV9_HOLLE|nr:hypothetical protein HOLleu_01328 [Holothuria leucospilota]
MDRKSLVNTKDETPRKRQRNTEPEHQLHLGNTGLANEPHVSPQSGTEDKDALTNLQPSASGAEKFVNCDMYPAECRPTVNHQSTLPSPKVTWQEEPLVCPETLFYATILVLRSIAIRTI